ncbi:hypothetical protein [Akkermansia sp.]|uniref:hypothetical protein n=1 Tax=Akkermansia sp. TaxID=1872421 RepID=UPI0025E526B8|nr:hypothetical protein [Akkermansia sp.]MEE0765781.1 hypothetical protein [Akkermansia sp.]
MLKLSDMNPRDAIFKAFETVRHPGNENLLHQAPSYMDDSDVSFLYPYEGKKWSEIDRRALVVEGSCLTALSDSGLLYVIPAYLLEFIRGDDYEDPNGWVDRLLEVLAHKGRGNLKLTPLQKKVIDDLFLKELEKTWEQYGRQGTCCSDHWDVLIAKARESY